MSERNSWLGLNVVAFAGVYQRRNVPDVGCEFFLRHAWSGLRAGQSLVAISPGEALRSGIAKVDEIRWPMEDKLVCALVSTHLPITAAIPAIVGGDLIFVFDSPEDKIQELERRIRALEGKAAK